MVIKFCLGFGLANNGRVFYAIEIGTRYRLSCSDAGFAFQIYTRLIFSVLQAGSILLFPLLLIGTIRSLLLYFVKNLLLIKNL